VVIGIETDIVEVVVLASGPDAFLSVGRPRIDTGQCTGPRGNIRSVLPRKIGTNWFIPACR